MPINSNKNTITSLLKDLDIVKLENDIKESQKNSQDSLINKLDELCEYVSGIEYQLKRVVEAINGR